MSSLSIEHDDKAANGSQMTATRLRSALQTRTRDGTLAMLAGGVALTLAVRGLGRRTVRAILLALASVGLIGYGVRRRRAEAPDAAVETGADVRRDESDAKRVSDSAHAEADRDLGAGRIADETASTFQSESEPNPRGMSDEAAVETDEARDVEFVDDGDDDEGRKTHLEDDTAHDTRLHPENDGERTRIDVSEAAMADEASEATGPHPEQAYPTQEGTDPEPTAKNAPERTGEEAVAPAGTDDGAADDPNTDSGDESNADSADVDQADADES